MPIKYVPFIPEPVEGQAVLGNFNRILRYKGADDVSMTLQRGMPLYEMEKQETVGENSDGNMVIRGECVSACAYLKEQGIQVDLVYIDPPFASGADYAKKVYIRRNPKVAEVIAQAEQELDVDELKAFEEKMYGDVWDKEKYLNWMYENLVYYRPFHELIKYCRGNAVSLAELSSGIFPNLNPENALKAISVLLAIAPLAKNAKGSVLFPARMHMLFKGISGVYACANANCSCSHSEGRLTLGEIYLSDGNLTCPHCGSVVYELYNDRRCGALFFKGYVLEDDSGLHGNVYLWHYPGQLMDRRMKEIHLFIPTSVDESELSKSKKYGRSTIKPCYLDVKSGFINFTDDSSDGKPWVRKLYYYHKYSEKGRPPIITFPTCPHCRHQFSESQLTSFSTRGNQSFFNLIKAQFQLQPAVPGKDNDPDRFPNEGRKVLLFSDSRQRAAKLARDMSEASDISAARQLFAIAIKMMEGQTVEQSINSLYDYFCLAAGQHHVQIFHGPERIKFVENCTVALNNYNRSVKRGREYAPRFTIADAPVQMQEYFLRLFAGGYNTLYDSATSWIEPTDRALDDAIYALDENNVTVTDEEFIELFNAWILFICDRYTAIGHTIDNTVRKNVRRSHDGYGLNKDWGFSKVIRKIMGWSDGNESELAWKRVLKEMFLDLAQPDNGRLYVDLSRVKLMYGTNVNNALN